MKRQLLVKIFTVLALIVVLAMSLMTSVSADWVSNIETTNVSVQTAIRSVSDLVGGNCSITVFSANSKFYLLVFSKSVLPTYLVCDYYPAAGATTYDPVIRVSFYDANFAVDSLGYSYRLYIYDGDAVIEYTSGWTLGNDVNISDTAIDYGEFGCLATDRTVFYAGETTLAESLVAYTKSDPSEATMDQYVQQIKNSTSLQSQYGLYTPEQIDSMISGVKSKTDDVPSDSSGYQTVLGYHWYPSSVVDYWIGQTNSWIEYVSNMQTGSYAEGYEAGKNAAYSEYNAVSGLIDGAVNTVSSTVGFFFDNIKVGTVTLGAVVSLVVIFLIVVYIVRKVK